MQANADQVERDILETQKKLQQVGLRDRQPGVAAWEAHWRALACPLTMVKMGQTTFVLYWPFPKYSGMWAYHSFSVGLLTWGFKGA